MGFTDFAGTGLDSYMQGYLDEVRLSSVPRSDAWISTEYNNQLDPASFVSSESPQFEGFDIFAWGRNASITIDHNKVAEDLTDFPVLLTEENLPKELWYLSSDAHALSSGCDLRFTLDATGTKLVPYEIVDFTLGTSAEVWVKLNLSSTVDTTFYIWWNNSNALCYSPTDEYGAQNVWSNNYNIVLHFQNSSIVDSANANSPTISGAPNIIKYKVGNGAYFDGNDAVRWTAGLYKSDQLGTVTFWADPVGSYNSFFSFTEAAVQMMRLYTGGGVTAVGFQFIDGGSNDVVHNTARSGDLEYYGLSTDGSDWQLYSNGAAISTTVFGGSNTGDWAGDLGSGTYYPRIGYDPSQGYGRTIYDEFRWSNVNRSEGWISTTYNNMDDPGSFSMTDQRPYPQIDFVTPPTPPHNSNTADTNATINVSLREPYLESITYNWNGTNFSMYDDDLVLMMNFDNVSALGEDYSSADSVVVDLSSHGNNGTTKNGLGASLVSGKYSNALGFDGIDDYIDIGQDLFESDHQGTISAWISSNIDPTSKPIFSSSVASTWNMFHFAVSLDNKPYIQHYNSGTGAHNDIAITTNALSEGMHHVVLTSDGVTWKIYIDGVEETLVVALGSNTGDWIGDLPAGLHDTRLGRMEYSANDFYFNGTMDEVRIWNRTLTSDEIYEQYISNLRKYNETQWYLYISQSKNATDGLDLGTYTYQACATDANSNENCTEERTINTLAPLDTTYPQISFVTPPTPVNDTNTTNTSIDLNVSITEQNLASLTYNWNGTNFSMYDDSLVLMMNFDNITALGENSTYVVDHSQYGNNGTGTFNGTGGVSGDGKYNGGVYFDGNGDYVQFDDAVVPMGAKTISAWIKTSDSVSEMIFLSNSDRNSGTGGDGSRFSIVADSLAYTHSKGTPGETMIYVGTTSFNSDGMWHHALVAWDGTTDADGVRLYLDGIEKNTDTAVGTETTPDFNLKIGSGMSSPTTLMFPFNGSIDEVRIWNRTLTSDEVYQQYVSNLRKYNETQWYLYVNQSKNATDGLDLGAYTYQACASDQVGNENCTEERTINTLAPLDTTYPQISFVTPPTPVNDTNTTNTSFEINVSIEDGGFASLTYDWNGTNFSMYDDDLVLMMNFDNVSALGENYSSADSTVIDLSLAQNNGTTKNGAGASLSVGKYGNAIDFDGANDYVTLGDIDSLDGLNKMTVSFWTYQDNVQKDWALLAADIGAASGEGITHGWAFQRYFNENNPLISFRNNNINQYGLTTDNSFTKNVWHFVTVVYDGTQATNANKLKYYLDSDQKTLTFGASTIPTSLGSNDQPLLIARHSDSGYDGYFNGKIDELRIWDQPLSADEIYQQYISNLRKYNETQWYLYVNQSKSATEGLDLGTYSYQACANDTYGNENCTEERTINILEDCTPSMTNTSWSNWYNISACFANDTTKQQRNRTQYDQNNCNETANTTFYENQTAVCDYPDPQRGNKCKQEWECEDWSECLNGLQIRECGCDCLDDDECGGEPNLEQFCTIELNETIIVETPQNETEPDKPHYENITEEENQTEIPEDITDETKPDGDQRELGTKEQEPDVSKADFPTRIIYLIKENYLLVIILLVIITVLITLLYLEKRKTK